MNDRFKFRAWDAKKKEWLLGYEMSSLGGFSLFGECMLFGEWANILNTFLFSQNGYTPDDLKIMQCTGLKDKNGKMIFEGDILMDKISSDNVDYSHGTYWIHGEPMLNYKISEEFEVIGNIYENPNLLQSKI